MRRQFAVAITDSPFENGDKEQAILGRIGAKVQQFHCTNESEVADAARNAHVIMCDASPVTRNVIHTPRGLQSVAVLRHVLKAEI